MLQYVCDWCKRAKRASDQWILGFAAERVNATIQRREITITTRWSSRLAAHPLSVHFCSEEHKNAYVQLLFDSKPRSQALTRSTARASGSIAGAVKRSTSVTVDREVQGGKSTAHTRRPSARCKQQSENVSFSETDHIRSHGLSVRLADDRATEESTPTLPNCWFGS